MHNLVMDRFASASPLAFVSDLEVAAQSFSGCYGILPIDDAVLRESRGSFRAHAQV
jgi:hypothetical protein